MKANASKRKWLLNPAAEGILFAILWLAVTNTTIYFIYARAVEAVKEEIRDGLLRNVSAAASIIDGDQHKKFKSKASKVDPEYVYFLKRLEVLRRASHDVRYMYTNIIRSGKVYFVANGSPQNDNDKDGRPDEAPQLMDPYPDAGKALLDSLNWRKPQVDREPYTDTWGTFYSAYAPFYDSKGQFVGTLGMDLELVSLQARLVPIGLAAQRAAFTSGILAVLFGTAVWYFRRANGSLYQRRLQAESALSSTEAERSLDRTAAAIQLAAVAEVIGWRCIQPNSDNQAASPPSSYGLALQQYAQARLRQAPTELDNFEPAAVIRAALAVEGSQAIQLEIKPGVPRLVFGSADHLRVLISAMATHPFARVTMGSLHHVEVDLDREELNTLELVLKLGYEIPVETRALNISSPIINEASTYAVFTITGRPNQVLNLVLGNTADTKDNDSIISGFKVDYSTDNGSHWSAYSWNGSHGHRPTIPVGGAVLVRVDISSEQDELFEGSETFSLLVNSDAGLSAIGIGTIRDDGTGTIYRTDATINTSALKDDDRPSGVTSAELAAVVEDPDLASHVMDEQRLTFATCCEQIRAVSGSIRFVQLDPLSTQLIITLPFQKYIES